MKCANRLNVSLCCMFYHTGATGSDDRVDPYKPNILSLQYLHEMMSIQLTKTSITTAAQVTSFISVCFEKLAFDIVEQVAEC
jgi:hypothetical protein